MLYLTAFRLLSITDWTNETLQIETVQSELLSSCMNLQLLHFIVPNYKILQLFCLNVRCMLIGWCQQCNPKAFLLCKSFSDEDMAVSLSDYRKLTIKHAFTPIFFCISFYAV